MSQEVRVPILVADGFVPTELALAQDILRIAPRVGRGLTFACQVCSMNGEDFVEDLGGVLARIEGFSVVLDPPVGTQVSKHHWPKSGGVLSIATLAPRAQSNRAYSPTSLRSSPRLRAGQHVEFFKKVRHRVWREPNTTACPAVRHRATNKPVTHTQGTQNAPISLPTRPSRPSVYATRTDEAAVGGARR